MNDLDPGSILALLHLACPIAAAIVHGMIVAQRQGGRRASSRQAMSRPSRWSSDERDVKINAYIETLRRARQGGRADDKAVRDAVRADDKAVRDAVRAVRRAERDEALKAKGITPGPMAWYWDLPDLGQAIVMGLALAVPLGGIVIVIFRAMLPTGSP